jgi:hypothetical protein
MNSLEINGRKFTGWQADAIVTAILFVLMFIPFLAGFILGNLSQ